MDKKVVIYSTPTCPYCVRAKQFLKDNNITYEDIDVSADSAKAEEMVKRTGQMGVPVIYIDDDIIIGFDKAAIKEALGLQ